MEPINHLVILNIYELNPPTSEENGNAAASFFSRLLKPIGLGTYHTSLEVRGYCYTFSAVAGIQKSSNTNKELHVPPGGSFKESITLGVISDDMDPGKINECINQLRSSFFTNTSYHLACRNCNSFSETFATALFLADGQEIEGNSLSSYPSWVNRLAKSGSKLIEHDDVCDVMKEARAASGVEGKVGWSLKPSSSSVATKNSNQSKKKKVLTEKQKKVLEKLRKK
jgi:hypothetical protein